MTRAGVEAFASAVFDPTLLGIVLQSAGGETGAEDRGGQTLQGGTVVGLDGPKRITVVRHLGELPPVYCYLRQVNQVLMNLLLNASQAIEGSGHITVSTRDPATRSLIEALA